MNISEVPKDIPTPWLDNPVEGRPATIDYEDKTMFDFLEEQAAQRPKQPAMILPKGKTITFSEFYIIARKIGSKLQQMGIKKGDRIALMMNNVPQYPMTHYACIAIGAVVVQVNPLYTYRELKYIVENSGARALFTLTMFQEKANRVLDETNMEFIVYTKIQDYLKMPIRLLGKLLRVPPLFDKTNLNYEQKLITRDDTFSFEDFVKAPDQLTKADVSMDDLAIFQYTGGTTGFPKGAMLTFGNVSANSQQVRTAFPTVLDGEGSVLTVLPMFHSFGLTGCMNLAVKLGVPMILNVASPPNFDDILDWIEKYHISFLPGVPRMFIEINKHPKAQKTNFTSLVAAISGGAPLPLEVARRFKEITGADLVEGYGLSETSPVAHLTPINVPPKAGSVGPPAADTFTKIIDIQDPSKVLDIGEVGEIVLKGPQVFKGYWNNEKATEEVLDENGWFRTGDIGKIDEDGWVYVIDRLKEMVLVSGYNVYPAEVEDVLFEHPDVEEVAVSGVPDDVRGEKIVAWIVPKKGKSPTKEDIIAFCKENMAPYKVPKDITFRQELPTSMVGKVLRRKILEEEGIVDEITPPSQ